MHIKKYHHRLTEIEGIICNNLGINNIQNGIQIPMSLSISSIYGLGWYEKITPDYLCLSKKNYPKFLYFSSLINGFSFGRHLDSKLLTFLGKKGSFIGIKRLTIFSLINFKILIISFLIK